jgi:phosphate transport system permease protein
MPSASNSPAALRSKRLHSKRRAIDHFATAFTWVATFIVLGLLTSILWQVVGQGLKGFSLSLFTQDTPGPGSQGGLRNAIAGSLLMVLGATFIATPLGILTGIFIVEYGKNNRWAQGVRSANDLLLSTPSIVAGLVVYTLIVAPLHHFSAWAGSIALSMLAIPVIVRATDNMLSLVPQALREAAIALGAPYWKMIVFISLRSARTGIFTGIILAVARITGETAPLLFTALNNQFFSLDINQPIANLPVVIFQFAMSPFAEWQQLAWSGALLITILVLGLSLLTRALLRLTERS